jgi:hypothetical protein
MDGGGFLFQRVICFTYHIFVKKTRPAETEQPVSGSLHCDFTPLDEGNLAW